MYFCIFCYESPEKLQPGNKGCWPNDSDSSNTITVLLTNIFIQLIHFQGKGTLLLVFRGICAWMIFFADNILYTVMDIIRKHSKVDYKQTGTFLTVKPFQNTPNL